MSARKVWPSRLGAALLAVIFVPLFAILFFGAPLELAVSSWHLATTRETTTGTVISSEVVRTTGRGGGTRSYVTYRYVVNGTEYRGTRICAGFLHESYSGRGGELAQSLKSGDPVLVYYSAGNPGFAFLQYGWPGLAVGFSLVVWGIVAKGMFGWMEPGSRKTFWLHALIDAVPLTGFGIIFAGENIIAPSELWEPAAIYGIAVLGVAVYSKIKYRNRPSRSSNFQQAPRWRRT